MDEQQSVKESLSGVLRDVEGNVKQTWRIEDDESEIDRLITKIERALDESNGQS